MKLYNIESHQNRCLLFQIIIRHIWIDKILNDIKIRIKTILLFLFLLTDLIHNAESLAGSFLTLALLIIYKQKLHKVSLIFFIILFWFRGSKVIYNQSMVWSTSKHWVGYLTKCHSSSFEKTIFWRPNKYTTVEWNPQMC